MSINGQWFGEFDGEWAGSIESGTDIDANLSGSGAIVATLTAIQVAQESYSGGYDYPLTRRKTKKEVYAERLKMGIVKEDIQQKAVEVVAKVQKVNYAPAYEYDPQQLVKQLMAELRVKVPSPDYTRAIELALRIAEQDEEEALLLLAY